MDQKPIVALITGTSYVPEMLFHEKLSDQVNIVTTRIPMRSISLQGLSEMLDDLPAAVDLLMASRPSLIAVPIMSGSCLRGEAIANLLEQRSGVPVLTSAQETLRIFQRLKLRRAALVSPFGVEINLVEKIFFSKAGIEISPFISTNENLEGDPYLVDAVDEAHILQSLRQADLADTDAILFDCPAHDIEPFVGELAEWYPKPVFSNTEVMMYRVLERLGLSTQALPLHRVLHGR